MGMSVTKIQHGRASHEYGVGRLCAYPGCKYILSRYNPDDICASHVLSYRPQDSCYGAIPVKVCTACHTPKPATTDFFHERNGSLVAQCKECVNAKRKVWKKAHAAPKLPTTIVCNKCGREKPATREYFHVRGDGLRRQCKLCANLARDKHHQRVKEFMK